MDLFGFDQQLNILPCDGEVYYFGKLIADDKEVPPWGIVLGLISSKLKRNPW